jgi:hypothetical protein
MLSIFDAPMRLSTTAALWLLLPICAVVSLVYKTLRARTVRQILPDTLKMTGYIFAGLLALAAGLWLLQRYW